MTEIIGEQLQTLQEMNPKKLAKENSQLNLSNSELVDLVEEQGKICTVLSAELVELIWSLTSKPSAWRNPAVPDQFVLQVGETGC